jgi:hypothetical protein
MDRPTNFTLDSVPTALYEMDAIDLSKQADKQPPQINAGTRKDWLEYLDSEFRRRSDYVGAIGSMAEARALLEKGWPDGARRLKALAEKLTATLPPAKNVRRRLRWSDDGDEASKDRLNGGFVDSCWRASKRELVASPEVLTVETNWGGTARRSADELFWQGAAAACLTDMLEHAGYRVELYANNYSLHPRGRTLLRIRVKEADAPVRIDTLAAVLCHAAVFRVFGLSAKEQALTATVYGKCVEVPDGVTGQDEAGRLWDILWMFRMAARRAQGDTLFFELYVRNSNDRSDFDERNKVVLKAVCGPGDDCEPVVTIMLPEED